MFFLSSSLCVRVYSKDINMAAHAAIVNVAGKSLSAVRSNVLRSGKASVSIAEHKRRVCL